MPLKSASYIVCTLEQCDGRHPSRFTVNINELHDEKIPFEHPLLSLLSIIITNDGHVESSAGRCARERKISTKNWEQANGE